MANNNKSIYFNELQQRIRDIRASERSAIAKIADVIAEAMDYDAKKMPVLIKRITDFLQTRSNAERFANYLLLRTEAMSSGTFVAYINTPPCFSAWTMSDVEQWAKSYAVKLMYSHEPGNHLLFRYDSYNGVLTAREGEEPNSSVRLPKELEAYKKNYCVLLVKDMLRLIERCSNISTDQTRPYDILAKLDRLVVECMPEGVFPANPVIDTGTEETSSVFTRFQFAFSHFEVDMQEPDPDFRTLYVVYGY